MIELLIYRLIRVPVVSVRYFLHDLYSLPKKSNVHLLHSFIHVFIHNSITKYFWQNFTKSLAAKAFRKTSNQFFLVAGIRSTMLEVRDTTGTSCYLTMYRTPCRLPGRCSATLSVLHTHKHTRTDTGMDTDAATAVNRSHP